MTHEQSHHLKENIIRDVFLFIGLLVMLAPVPFVSWAVYVIMFALTGYGFTMLVRNWHSLKHDCIRQRHKNTWYLVAWNTLVAIATLAVIIAAPLPPLAIALLGGLYLATVIVAAPFSFPHSDIK